MKGYYVICWVKISSYKKGFTTMLPLLNISDYGEKYDMFCGASATLSLILFTMVDCWCLQHVLKIQHYFISISLLVTTFGGRFAGAKQSHCTSAFLHTHFSSAFDQVIALAFYEGIQLRFFHCLVSLFLSSPNQLSLLIYYKFFQSTFKSNVLTLTEKPFWSP